MLEVEVKGSVGGFHIDAAFASEAGVTALFGQSGAGKSTITNMIAGLVTPASGRIVVDGQILFDSASSLNLPARDRRIGHVFQDARLFPHLSVRNNLTFAHWAGRRHPKRPLAEVVELLGISHLLDRKPGGLSGGEKQRVAIGRALLSDPRLLLMDEPLASLDQARKSDILPYLDRVGEDAGIPIVYVSHALEEVARLSQTLVIVSQGSVLAFGPVADMLARTDLGRATGRHEASALLSGKVVAIDKHWGLASIDMGGQIIQVPALDTAIGEDIRLRIRARDVAIALGRPEGLSIRNALHGTIKSITDETGPYTEILSAVDGQLLRARLTRASAADLGLVPGKAVTLLIKSVAIDRRQRTPAPRKSAQG
ncbi:molybdate transport system ATP-binding protein [Roseibium hamelinense]|uniref:Molybdate transport system ATP-binding protein n=1 Tax=Roseibium hamelinense TaxID=150831 RepID=A0A562SNI6_9HYPH|nr:molybdenum ABC transporter ATP-binding protein [Roseibium hamelinense]MTI44317.1 molybdenum ABC transporter ATP-binding protein [Roseibium hamelinense]TWI82907.1 molybdate transport system ATP-binding protein [Roseibium hamelinense]